MNRAVIIGTGLHIPSNKVTNDFFDQKYNKDVSTFLREQRNIHSRYFLNADEGTSDLIIPAATKAMTAAHVTAEDIDLLIVATDTPDYVSPSTASVVQHKLGLKNAGTFDLNSACSGFVAALDVAGKFITADHRYRNILVVGAYGMSKYFDWSDFKVTSVFADGAGAVVVTRSEEYSANTPNTKDQLGILASYLYTDGQYHDYMGIYAGGTKFPINQKSLEERQHLLQFVKRIPPETNSDHWPRLTQIVLDRAGCQLKDVKHFFFTQINIQSIVETMKRLNVPLEKAHNIMDQFGYTGSACIPMAIADAASKHKLKKGDLVMLLGSGGGMSIASVALRWGYDT